MQSQGSGWPSIAPIMSEESVPSSRYYSKNLPCCSRRTKADASPDYAFISGSLMIQVYSEAPRNDL